MSFHKDQQNIFKTGYQSLPQVTIESVADDYDTPETEFVTDYHDAFMNKGVKHCHDACQDKVVTKNRDPYKDGTVDCSLVLCGCSDHNVLTGFCEVMPHSCPYGCYVQGACLPGGGGCGPCSGIYNHFKGGWNDVDPHYVYFACNTESQVGIFKLCA
ncbi:hypothetical protein DPMN_037040 [Dreissena polymorpha]|uniref:Uncharacterized protein n=1 Tax=Dreissena polymorpha TaxID=45954 RepID=A0A9D4MAJ4_DREPO|nr:hypothetical protein DPMN_037040 [Dreissena polymorpha]